MKYTVNKSFNKKTFLAILFNLNLNEKKCKMPMTIFSNQSFVIRSNGDYLTGTYNNIGFSYKYPNKTIFSKDYNMKQEITNKLFALLKAEKSIIVKHETIKQIANNGLFYIDLAIKNRLSEKRYFSKDILAALENNTETLDIKENTKMNVNVESKVDIKLSETNVMKLAHILRKSLKLEGHYNAQMKIALTLAWDIKNNKMTIEEVVGQPIENESSAKDECAIGLAVPTEDYDSHEEDKKDEVKVEDNQHVVVENKEHKNETNNVIEVNQVRRIRNIYRIIEHDSSIYLEITDLITKNKTVRQLKARKISEAERLIGDKFKDFIKQLNIKDSVFKISSNGLGYFDNYLNGRELLELQKLNIKIEEVSNGR